MPKTCSYAGCTFNVFSKNLCKSHWQREYGKPIPKGTKPIARTPLKRSNKPIKKVSVKRQKQLDEYYPLRDAFLKEHKVCELQVDSDCTRVATEPHHLQGKENELLLDVSKWKAACRHCHDIVGEHSKSAIEKGQSLSRHKKQQK